MNKRNFVAGAVPVAVLAGGLATTLVLGGGSRIVQAQDKPALTVEQKTTANSLQDAFIRIADTVGPATVTITAQVVSPVQIAQTPSSPRFRFVPGTPGSGSSGGNDDDPFAELFGPGNSPFRQRSGPQTPREGQARGSGVIVRSNADGTTYILTNDHVVENAKNNQVRVTLDDDTTYTGQVFRDFRSDLAVVKIKANKPLPFVQLADSDALHVGQWAIAIGSPFGQQNTMTTGIVSALHRKKDIGDGSDQRLYPNLIQTDASINPGNSGGPLLNINGEMIGLNVAIFSPTGTNAGIGYAIPANTARRVVDQLIATGKVTRGALGIQPSDILPQLRQTLGTRKGAYVTLVQPDGAAEVAGILPGDVITRFGNKDIADEASLRDAIGATAPGTRVSITLLRNTKTQTVTATLKAAEDVPGQNATPAAPEKRPARALGMEVTPLSPDVRNQLKIPASVGGILVGEVLQNSPAFEAGLAPGVIITSVNGVPAATVETLNKAVASAKSGDVLTLQLVRFGQQGEESKPVRSVVNIIVP